MSVMRMVDCYGMHAMPYDTLFDECLIEVAGSSLLRFARHMAVILHASAQDASLCSLLSIFASSSCLLSFISLLQDSAFEQQESQSAAGSITCKV